ncbi:MAG: Crp/Fnr family transcriptional regulator [Bacteriovoracaceae bacterium]|nr:Crp/Fnr family transcriptional regulator [Bacteriovoracaceae bacterium]
MVKYELLYNKINIWSPIPHEEWKVLTSSLKQRKLAKGDFLLKEGEMASEIGFIVTGFCRQYFTNHDGVEFNHHFNFENELVAGYQSLLEKNPSRYSIQAMEDCDLLLMDYDQFEKFYERHSCWERLGRKAAENNYLIKIQRETSFLIRDAKERYLDVVKTLPEIARRVPQYHIASYLGITASALNRIIKKIEKES